MSQQILQKLEQLESLVIRGLKDVFTIKDASLYSGLGVRKMYQLTAQKRIEHFKPEGKHIYIRKSALDAYLLRNRIATSEELQDKALTYVTLRKKGSSK